MNDDLWLWHYGNRVIRLIDHYPSQMRVYNALVNSMQTEFGWWL